MRSYDIHNNIYIIYRGKVEILSSYNEMIACMGPGGIFGNIRQVSPGCSSISIVATRNLDVLVISNETFYNVIKEYPRIMRNMGNIIQTATDYIMPTTIIEDEEYEGNPIDMLSVLDLSSFTKDAPDSNALGKRSDINSEESPVKISSSFGTSHATHMSESGEKWVALKAACNIYLPCKWFRFAILPDNLIIKITSIGVLCISFYDVLYISYNFVTQNNNLTTLFITLSLEIIFYFKILLSFHETYMDRFGNYVTRFKKLSRSYFKNKTRVFWDIVPNLPVEPFCVCFTSENRLFALSALRMIHLLRLQYILSYFKMVNGKLLSNLAFNQILKIAIFMFITIHFFTCGWMMIASPFNEIVPNSWITVYNFTLYTPFHRYCVAAYYIINIGTTTGTGDIFPNSLYEISYTIFVILLCKFLTALIVGDLVSVINLASRSLVHYENRIHRLQYFLRNQSLSGHQMEKLWNYLRNLWTQEKGEHIPIMMKSCPYVMRCDIMTVMFGQHLRNSFLFHGVNSALVRQLAACLNRMIFFTGNYIVQDGDTDQNMYFIHSGEVSVLTVHANLTETQHELLKREDMFGLAQGLYHGLPHHFSYRANTTVSILALNLDSWYHMLKYFPKDKDLIYYRAQHVYATV